MLPHRNRKIRHNFRNLRRGVLLSVGELFDALGDVEVEFLDVEGAVVVVVGFEVAQGFGDVRAAAAAGSGDVAGSAGVNHQEGFGGEAAHHVLEVVLFYAGSVEPVGVVVVGHEIIIVARVVFAVAGHEDDAQVVLGRFPQELGGVSEPG